jgi:hypothetical protein
VKGVISRSSIFISLIKPHNFYFKRLHGGFKREVGEAFCGIASIAIGI